VTSVISKAISFYFHTSIVNHFRNKIVSTQQNIQGISQLLKQSDWAQIQDFK